MSLKLGDIDRFPFIDAPDAGSVKDGYRLLEELGAIEKTPAAGAGRRKRRRAGKNSGKTAAADYRLTKTGKLMARLPIDPRLARMLIAARDLGFLDETAVIAAALSIQDPRERPSENAA